MSASVMTWVFIVILLLLISLVVMAGMALSRLADIKEFWERARDRMASTESHLNQFDAVVAWLLQKEGMQLNSSRFGCRWYVVPSDDGKLPDWLERKNSALAEAIYKGYLQAMRDYAKEQKKETKKK